MSYIQQQYMHMMSKSLILIASCIKTEQITIKNAEKNILNHCKINDYFSENQIQIRQKYHTNKRSRLNYDDLISPRTAKESCDPR